MLDLTAEGRVSHVLTKLGEALAGGDLDRAVALFHDDCYWRDLVTFTWNIKTVEGKDAVASHAQSSASRGETLSVDRQFGGEEFPTKAASRQAGSRSRPMSRVAMGSSG